LSRKKAREEAFLLVFQMNAQKANSQEVLEVYYSIHNVDAEERNYINLVIAGIDDKLADIDSEIMKHLRDWKLDRISKVALASLRLAIFEAENLEDVPYRVAIDEAVSLAKKYEGEECAGFVNGILGQWSKGKE